MPKLRGCRAADELSGNRAGRQDYLYNGKEWNEDLGLDWYDYGGRYYDPAIGRFTGIDPLAEVEPAWTPYRYAFNNPLIYIDPDGLFESKKEAKQYAKKHDIRTGWFSGNKIREQNDGTFAIENDREKTSTSRLFDDDGNDLGVMKAQVVAATDVMDQVINEGGSVSLILRDGSSVEGYSGATFIGGTAPTPGFARVKKGMAIWNIAKKKVQKGGTFLPKKYLELFKKNRLCCMNRQ